MPLLRSGDLYRCESICFAMIFTFSLISFMPISYLSGIEMLEKIQKWTFGAVDKGYSTFVWFETFN